MSHSAQLISRTLRASLLTSFLALATSCTPSTHDTTGTPAAVPAPATAAAPAATPEPAAPAAEAPPTEAATVDPVDAAPPAADASPASKDGFVKCPERRSNMCTKIYLPVCADVDTGIRCVRAPCPSLEHKTYASDCTACSDPKVIGHRPGACKAAAPSTDEASAKGPSIPGAVAE